SDYEWLHDLLVHTVQHTTRAFYDQLAASDHGRFVLVSSSQAQQPNGTNASYAATKAAAESWTLALAAAFKDTNATANIIVFNGTGANVTAIDALTEPHEAVICTDVAHMNVDECGAPERIAGIKLLQVANTGGKLTPDDVSRWEAHRGDEHAVQPRVVSITQ